MLKIGTCLLYEYETVILAGLKALSFISISSFPGPFFITFTHIIDNNKALIYYLLEYESTALVTKKSALIKNADS